MRTIQHAPRVGCLLGMIYSRRNTAVVDGGRFDIHDRFAHARLHVMRRTKGPSLLVFRRPASACYPSIYPPPLCTVEFEATMKEEIRPPPLSALLVFVVYSMCMYDNNQALQVHPTRHGPRDERSNKLISRESFALAAIPTTCIFLSCPIVTTVLRS